MAENFNEVLKGKYPAKSHAKRVVQLLREKVPDANGLIYLEGTHEKLQEDNDSPVHFRYGLPLAKDERMLICDKDNAVTSTT